MTKEDERVEYDILVDHLITSIKAKSPSYRKVIGEVSTSRAFDALCRDIIFYIANTPNRAEDAKLKR